LYPRGTHASRLTSQVLKVSTVNVSRSRFSRFQGKNILMAFHGGKDRKKKEVVPLQVLALRRVMKCANRFRFLPPLPQDQLLLICARYDADKMEKIAEASLERNPHIESSLNLCWRDQVKKKYKVEYASFMEEHGEMEESEIDWRHVFQQIKEYQAERRAAAALRMQERKEEEERIRAEGKLVQLDLHEVDLKRRSGTMAANIKKYGVQAAKELAEKRKLQDEIERKQVMAEKASKSAQSVFSWNEEGGISRCAVATPTIVGGSSSSRLKKVLFNPAAASMQRGGRMEEGERKGMKRMGENERSSPIKKMKGEKDEKTMVKTERARVGRMPTPPRLHHPSPSTSASTSKPAQSGHEREVAKVRVKEEMGREKKVKTEAKSVKMEGRGKAPSSSQPRPHNAPSPATMGRGVGETSRGSASVSKAGVRKPSTKEDDKKGATMTIPIMLAKDIERRVGQLQKAVDDDEKAKKAGKPALSRIMNMKGMGELCTVIKRNKHAGLYAVRRARLLSTLHGWVEVGDLPKEGKMAMLDLLEELPMDLNKLKESGIGKSLRSMAQKEGALSSVGKRCMASMNKIMQEIGDRPG